MINKFQRFSLYSFIVTSTFGYCLYFGFFSFYLVKIKTSPFIISLLIGATALTSLFWGPLAGRIIDNSRRRFSLLIIAQIICGIFVFVFGLQDNFRHFFTSTLVLLFSLTFNFATIIINQYLLPIIHEDYERSVSKYSYISGLAVFLSGIALAALYEKLSPFVFFTFATGCFFASALAVLPLLNKEIVIEVPKETHKEDKKYNIYYNSIRLLRKHWFLALAMCVMAFTETSFNTNFDVIAFTTGTTPFAVVFLFGALSGILDSLASWLYPQAFGNRTVTFRWNFFFIVFFLIFAIATLLTLKGYNQNPWFLPALALFLELTGIWWAIFIAGRVRDTSHHTDYGQTMAAFRVPRSLITFIGVTSIGSALQSGKLEWILSFNTCLLAVLLIIHIFWQEKKNSKDRIIQNSASSQD